MLKNVFKIALATILGVTPGVNAEPITIEAGDSANVVLQHDVNAPTDGETSGALFAWDGKLDSPDCTKDIGAPFQILAEVHGSLVDSRALFALRQVELLSSDENKKHWGLAEGWAVGPDGVRGIRGRLLDVSAEYYFPKLPISKGKLQLIDSKKMTASPIVQIPKGTKAVVVFSKTVELQK